MGFKTVRENFRVEVIPKGKGDFGYLRTTAFGEYTEDEAKQVCIDIVQQIKRHVNDVESACVKWDTHRYCEHCGCIWTEGKESTHNGGCCDADCVAYYAENPEQTPTG